MQNSKDLAKTQFGTPFYMAPEIFDGQKYDKKADIWSLGIILYELITMEPPFYRPNIDLIKNSILKNLVKSMLSKNPNERPSIDAVFEQFAINYPDARLYKTINDSLCRIIKSVRAVCRGIKSGRSHLIVQKVAVVPKVTS